jgi:hypothetical protein
MPNEEITADSVELNVNSLESIEMPGSPSVDLLQKSLLG